jgi:hypothetical protein
MKSKKSRLSSILITCIILCISAIQAPVALSSVNSEIIVTTDANSGVGSLRWAIEQANNHLGPDIIHFNINNATISPLSNLPPIMDNDTVIDASPNWSGSWPMGRPGITINGSSDTSGNPTGIRIVGAQNVTIKGLEIENFSYCVWLYNASNTTIGEGAGTHGGGRMLIHSCSGPAVHIFGGQQNKVLGAYIGVREDGSLPEPNGGEGISIDDSQMNEIGGWDAYENNIIGASAYGIYIKGSKSSWNTMLHNQIGGDPIGNVNDGVFIGDSATNNQVGTNPIPVESPDYDCQEDGNYIGYNGGNGVTLSGVGNLHNGVMCNLIDNNQGNGIMVINQAMESQIYHNTIIHNSEMGIFISQPGASGQVIKYNKIGIEGTWANPNGKHGIGLYDGTSDNTLQGNAIGNNGWSGVAIVGVNTMNNYLYRNQIGSPYNDVPMGNAYYGVDIIQSRENTLTENVITNNGTAGSFAGVHIQFDTAVGNAFFMNSIYANSGLGIELTDRSQHEIGAPVINGAACSAVSGIAGPVGARVDIFSDSSDEGRYFEGSTTVNAQYQWTYSGSFRGPNLTAIVTDLVMHDSSAFSAPWGVSKSCYETFLPMTQRYK